MDWVAEVVEASGIEMLIGQSHVFECRGIVFPRTIGRAFLLRYGSKDTSSTVQNAFDIFDRKRHHMVLGETHTRNYICKFTSAQVIQYCN